MPAPAKIISFFIITVMGVMTLFLLSLSLGTYTLSPQALWQALQPDSKDYFTLIEYRLPRAVLAIIMGAALAVSGTVTQSVIRNPLASPDILGINAAAGLVAVIVLVFFPHINFYLLPILVFIGGLSSFFFLWLLCSAQFKPLKMAITGVALSGVWSAISHYLILLHPVDINIIMIWLTGGLWGRGWQYVIVSLPWLFIFLPIPFIFAHRLDMLCLGENKANTLGIDVSRVQIIMLLLAVALSTTAVSVCGPIVFLGLVAPHLARQIVGGRHRYLLPASLLIGVLLFQLADILGRTITPPVEIPSGILISILGAPYFFFLLMKVK